mmetsp:Transcript_28038/g.34793  ORF Transcript_28038/g.34793 Transcript_28038/m.34793 type:complete len:124 (+) Transcript_28038:1001-1372(+)
MRLLDHLELLFGTLAFPPECISLVVFLAHLDLHLAYALLLVLKLVFKVDPLRLKLLNLLPEIELNHACVFDFHFFSLKLSHLVKHLVFFGGVLGFCLAHSSHEQVVLLTQLDLVFLLHAHLVL